MAYPTLAVHFVAPAADHEFAGHAAHGIPPSEYVPAAHVTVHTAALVPVPSALDVPAGHDWQAVEVPSRKYWPDEQHTAVPVGVQRLVLPWDVQVGVVSAHETKLVLAGPVTVSSAQFMAPLAAVLTLCRYTYRPDALPVNGYEVLITALIGIVYMMGALFQVEVSFAIRTSTFRKWSTQQLRVKYEPAFTTIADCRSATQYTSSPCVGPPSTLLKVPVFPSMAAHRD
jgi:hypothetical protein